MTGRIMHEIVKGKFISFAEKNFTSENGEVINYYVLHYFPVEKDGTVIMEPEKTGVNKKVAEKFKNFKEGDLITMQLEAYVTKSKVSDVKMTGM